MKVLLSTGNGRLHLMTSATYLKKKKVNVNVLTGWIPRDEKSIFVQLMSLLSGHKNLAAGMKKRLEAGSEVRMISQPIPEFFTQFLFLFSRKTGWITKDTAASIGWTFFGWCSGFRIKGYDVFHVRAGAGRGHAIKRAKNKGLKVVVDQSIAHPLFFDRSVNSEIERHGKPPFISCHSRFWNMVLSDCHAADILLVNSDFVKQTFVDSGFDPDKIRVVYLGVREDFYRIKQNYEKENAALHILFTGGFELRKGAEYILKAMQDLDRENFPYKLTVVGSNVGSEDLLEKYPIKELDLVGHVPQDELKKYLSSADVYLFPSLAEGCAVSAMEAMAAGLPVIVTKESGLPVISGRDGLRIESKNVNDIKSAIYKLDGDITLRRELGRNAAEAIVGKYSWDLYADKVDSIYRELT